MVAKKAAPKVGELINPSETITAGQEKTLAGLGLLKTISGVITIAGTTLDIASNVSDNREAKKMQKEQEKKIAEKEKRIKRKNRKKYWREESQIATKNVLRDVFDDATGHTRYGASKLPGS